MSDDPLDWLPEVSEIKEAFVIPRAAFKRMVQRVGILHDNNKGLERFYKEWQEQQEVIEALRRALEPFAKLAELSTVDRAYEYGKWVELIISFDPPRCRPQIVRPDMFVEAAYLYKKTTPRSAA
jgi:hypothetical protein